VACDVANAIQIGDGRAAKFHHQPSHVAVLVNGMVKMIWREQGRAAIGAYQYKEPIEIATAS